MGWVNFKRPEGQKRNPRFEGWLTREAGAPVDKVTRPYINDDIINFFVMCNKKIAVQAIEAEN